MQALGGGRMLALAYRRALRQPDLLAPATTAHLTQACRTALAPPWPDLAVACGRRTAPVLRWLKAQAGGHVQAVYLMRPASLSGFDLVVIPEHDRAPGDPRIIRSVGALHPFDRHRLDLAAQDLSPAARALPEPYTTVLVGGPTRRVRFGAGELEALAERVNALVRATGGAALVTTSRRTPKGGATLLRRALTIPHLVHDAQTPGPNPLHAWLGAAARIVVTADSVSMLSEAAAAGRPLEVFALPGTPAKVQHLQARLTSLGHITPSTAPSSRPPAALNEAHRIASLITRQLQTRQMGL